MNDTCSQNNYDIAKAEADKVDAHIIEVLQSGRNFRVEAGAGSGKTYSLNKVLEWIAANKLAEYRQKRQTVICITFTNAAVDVIKNRLPNDPAIVPSTIHSFAWNAIKQYQSFLINACKNDPNFASLITADTTITEVTYNLGHRSIADGILSLYHNDVLNLFCYLLKNAKFRRIFANKYPLILIDEYQDTSKAIIDSFIEYFISRNTGPQFAFFGDAWQTIYGSKVCGLIDHQNLEIIKKGANFRSAPKIVELLNKLRPDLPQKSAINDFEGEVIAITCDDYPGLRQTSGIFKNDLPTKDFQNRLDTLIKKIKAKTPETDTLKTLMITHKVLATQQGYAELFDILGNKFKEEDDPFLLFFKDTVEPAYKALTTNNMQLLFDTLNIKRYPITQKAEKLKWKNLQNELNEARKKKAINVFEVVHQSHLIPIPPQLENLYSQYCHNPDELYSSKKSISSFLNLGYSQFISAIHFLYPDSIFSTEHGVKGEEYDNVIFVISKGWYNYQFDVYAPMITKKRPIPLKQKEAFERNRNLFYVCCSRPKKRLIFFISIPVSSEFRAFLNELIGSENIYSYDKYLKLNP